LTLSGCQSPDKKLVSHYGDVSEVYQAYAIQPIETESLTWEDAEVRLLRGNLGLIGASNGILLARENTQRVFLNLMPSLNITANLAKRLTNIGQLDERDLDIGIFSSVSVPGIIQLRLNHYTALLQEVRAAWVWELEKRQRTVQLHQLFIRQKNLDRRSRTLRLSALADSQTGLAGEIVGERPAELERKNRLWALDRDYDRLQLDISRLLGDFSARWTLNTNSLPILYPPHTLPNLTEKDRIAVLWRQLQATELEAARLRERGAVLDYWPELIQLFGPTDGKDRLKEENMTNQLKSERLATQQLLNHLNDPAIRVLAQELTNLKLRMRELEHEKQLAEARIEMPFDGYYQVLLPVETGRAEVKVLQGAALLRVEDLKEIHATVEIYGVRWRQFPRERLTLRIPGMHGLDESDQAPFNKIVAVGIDPLSGALRYSFAFRGEAAERAAILRGGTVTAEILLKLGDQPARIVPKLDLLEAYPEAFRDSWEAGASQVFENLEAIYVGREALALLFTPE